MARRKRLRNSARDDYEFELLDEEEAEGLNSGEKKGAAGKKGGRRTRGGELYDAFAGGSDDEDDEFGADEYRDRTEEMSGARQPEMSEKRGQTRGLDDDEEEEEHHVVGDSDDDEESGDDRPLRGGR